MYAEVVKGKYGQFAEFVVPFHTVEEIRATIARSIGQARRRRGLSQTALAEEVGRRTGRALDPSQVSDWETGKNLPRIDVLVALAGALETSLDLLVSGEDSYTRQVARAAVEEAKREYGERLSRLESRIDELAERPR